MFNSILGNTTTSSIELTGFLICAGISLVLGFVIALTHKYTSRYSNNFLITITLLPILVMSIMLMVNGNLGTSIAIMGAFSLVRFRSLPGTSREILIVFFAMAVGLATGMGQIWFAIFITIIGCVMLFILNSLVFSNKKELEQELKISIPENLDYPTIFDDIFEEYTSKITLERTRTTNLGSIFELTYQVVLKSGVNEKEFIDKIRVRNSNLKVSLSRSSDTLDL